MEVLPKGGRTSIPLLQPPPAHRATRDATATARVLTSGQRDARTRPVSAARGIAMLPLFGSIAMPERRTSGRRAAGGILYHHRLDSPSDRDLAPLGSGRDTAAQDPPRHA